MPTQSQLVQASLLRSVGFNPSSQTANSAGGSKQAPSYSWEDFSSSQNTLGYTGKGTQGLGEIAAFAGYKGPALSEQYNTNLSALQAKAPQHDGGDTSQDPANLQISFDQGFSTALKDYKFTPTKSGNNPAVVMTGPSGSKVITTGEGLTSFDKFAMQAIPAGIGMLAGSSIATGALGLTGASAGAATGAIGGGINTLAQGGNLSDILTSALKGGVGGGVSSGLSSVLGGYGVNPLVAKGIGSAATGMLSGQNPKTALLMAVVGGVSKGNPIATTLAKYLLTKKG